MSYLYFSQENAEGIDICVAITSQHSIAEYEGVIIETQNSKKYKWFINRQNGTFILDRISRNCRPKYITLRDVVEECVLDYIYDDEDLEFHDDYDFPTLYDIKHAEGRV